MLKTGKRYTDLFVAYNAMWFLLNCERAAKQQQRVKLRESVFSQVINEHNFQPKQKKTFA